MRDISEGELKSCPFCGGSAKLKKESSPAMGASDTLVAIVCTRCRCQTKDELLWDKDPVDIVVGLWNNRLK